MECLEFRRRLLIDPLCKEGDLLEHEEHCDECTAFARDLRRKEIRLRALMRSIEPRPSLGEDIRKEVAGHPMLAKPPSYYLPAMALALVVAIAATWWALRLNPAAGPDPARLVLQHIEHESSHLAPGPAVPRFALDSLFARFGAQLSGNLGDIYFAAECLMATDTGVHLVTQGEKGPVTFLMMPGEALSQNVTIESPEWRGRVTPTPWGSVAVVGRIGEPTDLWTQRLLDSLVWPGIVLPSNNGLAAR